jgi:hypothetical protein
MVEGSTDGWLRVSGPVPISLFCIVFSPLEIRNGEFEMTTASSDNSFLRNGNLYIVPTLTSDEIGVDAIFNNYTYNLTDCTYNVTRETYPTSTSASAGSVSGSAINGTSAVFDPDAYHRACGAVSNSATGAVINPVKSARLSTRNSASIRYGKVEVRAKLPSGWVVRIYCVACDLF